MTAKVFLPTFRTAGEERAYLEGKRINDLMRSPQYRDPTRRDPRVVGEVDGYFRRHYGTAAVEPARSAGGAARGGFDRGH